MKNALKVAYILLVGLAAAIIIYPFLHESGHSLVAALVGAKVVEFNIFPIPNIICDVRNVGAAGKVLIGLGGMIFPFALTLFLNYKRFFVWYVAFTVRWINLLSFFISSISVFLFLKGTPFQADDITQIIQISPQYLWVYVIMLFALITIETVLIIKSKPIQKFLDFID